MGIDILLNTCHLSNEFEDSTNPFTGESIKVPLGETITQDERKALMEFISSYGEGPDEIGFCRFDLGEHGTVVFQLYGIEDDDYDFRSGSFTLNSLSHELSATIFEMIDIGGFIAIAATSTQLVFTTRSEYAQEAQSRWSQVQIVKDSDALHAALRGPFETWQTYRDQAVEELD